MTEILIHGAVKIPPINWKGVPLQYVRKVSAVCRTLRDCEELVKWFGDPTFAPMQSVLVQTDLTWVEIAGLGIAPAAELQDCAIVVWHRHHEAAQKSGRLFDFDELRQRHGLMRKEDVPAAMREAIERRRNQHKANPVTDPFRQPRFPNPTAKVGFLVDGTRDGFTQGTQTPTESGLQTAHRDIQPAGTGDPSEGSN